ncbi:hypothetical protein MLD38_009482 [Melastoma candidum]|uniref:Uncharacterized protein n=1 Tax=Melastoma candidum TaxID=119954 RepID=A0ACB9S221_9MYRT|nr:hypothetical protein MLD38_009482 [Melastoma candidum]
MSGSEDILASRGSWVSFLSAYKLQGQGTATFLLSAPSTPKPSFSSSLPTNPAEFVVGAPPTAGRGKES